MYIALKWLIGLTFVMWVSMCVIDAMVKRKFEIQITEEGPNQTVIEITRNTTIPDSGVDLEADMMYYKHITNKPKKVSFLPCFMFLAGALVVSLYNRKNDIMVFTKQKFTEMNTRAIERFQDFFEITLSRTCGVSIKYSKILWVYMNIEIIKLWNKFWTLILRKELQKPRINIILLKKLQEIGEERKNLGQLLIAAIHENKNIRMQYELENLAKNRLAQHIENTQKLIKENRTRYISFQQLYLVTHQENSYLKNRVKKLVKEKDEAEKNLLELMNEVYKSKNNQLKSFCSRFIVRTTENLLNADVGVEIQKFLDKSHSASTSKWQVSDSVDTVCHSYSWPKCANPRFEEIIQDDVLVPLVSDAPKLKGLPGEFVWTVKDKDGLIEKLYEYDYDSDIDDGDTIRRIRQYSVYYDKDCLLDFTNSRTVVNENRTTSPLQPNKCIDMERPTTTQGFLTGSEAFQKFMQNNRELTPRLPRPPLPSS